MFAGAISAVLGLAPAAAAQSGVTLDVGAAHIRYADTVSTNALTVSPILDLGTGRASLRAAGVLSHLNGRGWTGQGAFDGSLYSGRVASLVGELTGSAGGSTHEDGTRTGQVLALGRMHLAAPALGLWIGGGGGGAWDGDVWRPVLQAEAAVWADYRDAAALLTVSPTAVDDTIRYLDTQLAVGWDRSRVEVTARAGYRAGQQHSALGEGTRFWGGVDLVAWVTPWAGIVASGGTYPVDFTQGFPGGEYAVLGFRIRPAPDRRAADQRGPAYGPVAAAAGGVMAFEAVRDGDSGGYGDSGGCCTIRVRAPDATRVELIGDPTDWQAIVLKPAADGWWTVALPVAPGTHQVNVRVDGGAWLVPPGLTPLNDEFGGSAGLLIIR